MSAYRDADWDAALVVPRESVCEFLATQLPHYVLWLNLSDGFHLMLSDCQIELAMTISSDLALLLWPSAPQSACEMHWMGRR